MALKITHTPHKSFAVSCQRNGDGGWKYLPGPGPEPGPVPSIRRNTNCVVGCINCGLFIWTFAVAFTCL